MANHESSAPPPDEQAGIDYLQIQKSDEFQDLRRTFRGFVFPLTAFFLIWYFAYVILAAYFPEFMSTPVFGLVNVGLLFGFAQFVTTFGITIWYVRWASRTFDPAAKVINDKYAGGIAK